MSEQQVEQPTTDRTEVTETEAEEQQPETRQDRRDGHVRERLKEVETERDTLRTRLDSRDVATVTTMAKAVLGEHGAGLFTFNVADLRNEDGDLDADLVAEAMRPLRMALEEGRVSHHGDMGVKATVKRAGPTWGQVIGKSR